MIEHMTAAQRHEYHSAEATRRRSYAAADLINAAWELAGTNGAKVRMAELEHALLLIQPGAAEPLMSWDEYTMALAAHVDAGHIWLQDGGDAFTVNL